VSLREKMRRHMKGPLTRLAHHGEEIVHVAGEGTRTTVRAVVDRLDVESSEGTTRVARLTAVVSFPNDPVDGVGSLSNKDTFELAMRLGGPTVTARYRRLITQDEGAFLVEVST